MVVLVRVPSVNEIDQFGNYFYYIKVKLAKVSRGSEGSLFNSFCVEVEERPLLLFLDYTTLPLYFITLSTKQGGIKYQFLSL